MITTIDQARKLELRVKRLVGELLHRVDLAAFERIDTSAHMEGIAELEFLIDQLEELRRRQEKLEEILCNRMKVSYERWKDDFRWWVRHQKCLTR